MRKKTLRFSLASLAITFYAPYGIASSPELYGVIDIYMGAIKSGSSTKDSMDSGGLQSSRFGLRGSEKLSGKSAITYTLEGGFNTNDGTQAVAGSIFNRQTWIGYRNEKIGEFRLGNQNSVFFNMLGRTAAFYGGTFGAGLGTMSGYHFRSNNDLSYITKSFNGWKGEFHYSREPRKNHSGSNYGIQAAIQYDKGPVYVMTGYVQRQLIVGTEQTINRQFALGGSYDLSDKLTAYLGYFKNKQDNKDINKQLYSASIAWHLNSTNQLSLGYTRINLKADRANTANKPLKRKSHADHYGVMYLNRMSKRTTLYVAGAYIKNGSNVDYAIGAAQAPQDSWRNRPKPGQSTKGVQIGFRHTF